jgi:murein tripeptide amidase MpaA
MEWLDGLTVTNEFISTETFGASTEGRELRVFKIASGGSGKPALWIDATIHAREWISTSTITYIINQLVTRPTNYTDILDAVDIYFVPFVNPDGYVFSHASDRLWRKTRSNYGNYSGDCIGVDANRNFGFKYGGDDGSSSNPCSLTYRGPNAYSEPESAGVDNYVLSRSSAVNWTAFITLHSYSQVIICITQSS